MKIIEVLTEISNTHKDRNHVKRMKECAKQIKKLNFENLNAIKPRVQSNVLQDYSQWQIASISYSFFYLYHIFSKH